MEFLPCHFYLFHKGDWIFFFIWGTAGNIYFNLYIIFISTSIVDRIFISTMPCGHLFIPPIFPTQLFISKKLHPSILMVPPPPPQTICNVKLVQCLYVFTLCLPCGYVKIVTVQNCKKGLFGSQQRTTLSDMFNKFWSQFAVLTSESTLRWNSVNIYCKYLGSNRRITKR